MFQTLQFCSSPVKQNKGVSPGLDLDLGLDLGLDSEGFKMDDALKQWTSRNRTLPVSVDQPGPRRSLDSEFSVSDLSTSTVQRQRKELQLLMTELRDRDEELNNMAAAHHQQLQAWERDRRRLLSVEQRCSRLDDELQKRNEVIGVLTKRIWSLETSEKEAHEELGVVRRQLQELEEKRRQISQKCQDVEEKNQSLNSTVVTLSTQVGSLQVREEQLSSTLRLKDKDASEASGRLHDLSRRLRDLETSLDRSRSRETKLQKDLEENKRRHRETRREAASLRELLQQQVGQSSSQREEIIRLKQELQLLRSDLSLTEGDVWRDELLEMCRSKQERTTSELLCLRQVCENQRNDLQLLQLNLERARESLREKSRRLDGSQDESPCNCSDAPSSSSRRRLRDDAAAATIDDLRTSTHHVTDGDELVSSCFIQQLLGETAAEPLFSLKTQTQTQTQTSSPRLHQHHPTNPPHKVDETPPRHNKCLQRSTCGRLGYDFNEQ